MNEIQFEQQHRASNPEALAAWIKRASAEDQRLFEQYYGPERFRRIRNAVLHSSDAVARGFTPSGSEKTNVVVIPGIMGSELSLADSGGAAYVLWLSLMRLFLLGRFSYLRLQADGMTPAEPNLQFTASGLLRKYYDEMEQRLLADCNVRHFAYDWRKDVRTSAAHLDAFLEGEFGNKPVHLIAHSMGGLVSRLLLLRRHRAGRAPQDLLGGGRLIMLGTPNHGSYEVPQIITGLQDSVQQFIRGMRATSLFRKSEDDAKREVLAVVNSFPAVYQMLPSPAMLAEQYREKLYLPTTYGGLSLQVSAAHLQSALKTHKELEQAIFPEVMVTVAGCNTSQPTAVGVRDVTRLGEKLGYELSNAGDGRVAHHLCELPGVPIYYVVGDHGGLPENSAILERLSKLLANEPPGLSTNPDDPTSSDSARGTRGAIGPGGGESSDELWQRFVSQSHAERQMLRGTTALPAVCDSAEKVAPATPAEIALEERLTAGLVGPEQPEPTEVEGIAGGPRLPLQATEVSRTRFWAPIDVEVIMAGIETDGVLTGAAFPPGSSQTPLVDCVSVGHYQGVRPDGAEETLDMAISLALLKRAGDPDLDDDILPQEKRFFHQATARGLFRGELGEVYLVEDLREPREGESRVAALVGMGPPGNFGAPELVMLVRQLCWTMGFLGRKHLATVLIGGRRGGLSADIAILAWLRGVARAVAEMPANRRGRQSLRRLTFVEHYPDRAVMIEAALRSLSDRARGNSTESGFEVDLDGVRFRIRTWSEDEHKKVREECLKRCRKKCEDEADRLQSPARQRSSGEVVRLTVESTAKRGTYRFALLTSDASIPERELTIDERLIDESGRRLIAKSQPEEQLNYGELLLRLILPRDFRKELQSASPVVLILDSTTARIPWEMTTTITGALEGDKKNDDRFLSLGRQLTRQFRTVFAPTPDPLPDESRDLHVLIVADPADNARLEGAREEAVLLGGVFDAFNRTRAPEQGKVRHKMLVGPREASRIDVLREVMLNQYDVLHYAGHCMYDVDSPSRSGWIFGEDDRGRLELLTANELDRIDRVPRLVFSNACESGITPDRADEGHTELAPSFAEAFFKQGVQNFICTGWPVNDRAAREFAITVYAGMLGMRIVTKGDGSISFAADRPYLSLSEALQEARRRILPSSRGRRTWGAYQHYGNPEFSLFPLDRDRERPPSGVQPGPKPEPESRDRGAPGTAPQPAAGDRFAAVRTGIEMAAARLKQEFGAIEVRPGFRVQDGWITEEPAIVAVVPPGRDYPADRQIDGVPVDFAPATPRQMLMHRGLVPEAAPEDLRSLRMEAVVERNLAPGEQLDIVDETRKRVITHPYKPTSELKKKLKMATIDRLVCHLSPDSGWPVLKEFLEATRKELVIGMYDFTAPHVLAALKASLKQSPRRLSLVLDPGQALDNGGDPDLNPKANDKDEDDVLKQLERSLADRLEFAWAAVKTTGKTSGSTFPSAYHIKVAVRDGKSFWLSSGNWQSSNQPPDAEEFSDNLPGLFRRYNREWHVVIDSVPLAETYRDFLNFDLKEAAEVQETERGLTRLEFALPELFVPEEGEVEERAAAKLKTFEPLELESTPQRPIKVIPLLTPDNYAKEVLKVIEKATTRLYFQNQYIKIGKVVTPEFRELLEALKQKMNEIEDAKIILRKLPPAREMVETLIDQGFPPEKIRLMSNTHTKGIIVDSHVCVLGSHNWSSDGTTSNRDASLIFDDERIAEYYERAFLHDWDGRARAQVFDTRSMPRIVSTERGLEPSRGERGTVVPWLAWFEEE